MRLHRWTPAVVLFAVGTAAPGGGEAGDAKERRLSLPTQWQVGSVYRYQALWSREIGRWSMPGGPPPSLAANQPGEVTIRVLGESGSAYQLHWEPVLPPLSGPPRAKGDVDAAGRELWRHGLGQLLELTFDPQSADRRLVLRNEPALRAEVSRVMRGFLRELPGGEDLERECDEPGSKGPCAVLAAPERLAATWLQYAGPFFNCSGLDLTPGSPETWSLPHPHPAIGAAVSVEYRREVVDYDARSPRIRIRTVTQPNAKQLDAYFAREMARIDPSGKVAEALSQAVLRFETTCTMDLKSGWPVAIEQRAIGSTKAYEMSEIARFELIDQRLPGPE